MAIIKCPNCGAENDLNSQDNNVCAYCGTLISTPLLNYKRISDIGKTSEKKMYLPFGTEFQSKEGVQKLIVRTLSMYSHPENLSDDIEIKSIKRYYIPLYRFINKVILLLPNVGPKECKFDFVIPAISDNSGLKINNFYSRYFMAMMNDRYHFKDSFINSNEITETEIQSIWAICVQPDIAFDGSEIKQSISERLDSLCREITNKIDKDSHYISNLDYTIEESLCDGVIYYLPQMDIKYIYKDVIYNAYLHVKPNFIHIWLDHVSPLHTDLFIEAKKRDDKIREERLANFKKEQKSRREDSEAKAKKERLMRREEETRKQNEKALQRVISDAEQYRSNSVRWIIGSLAIAFLIIGFIAQSIFDPSKNQDNIPQRIITVLGLAIMISEGLNIIYLNFGNKCKKEWENCKDFVDENLTRRYRKIRRKNVIKTVVSLILFVTGLIILIVGQNL